MLLSVHFSEIHKKLNPVLILFLAAISVVIVPENAWSMNQCFDILRDGIRDQIRSSDSRDYKLAAHYQFCSIAKEHHLDAQNFDSFAKAYSERAFDYSSQSSNKNSSNSSFNAGGGFGLYHANFGYSQGQASDQSSYQNQNHLSKDDKIRFLKDNKNSILDYYSNNCASQSYEESLQAEQTHLSLIANKDIINAWRDCMLNAYGFFVNLSGTQHQGNEIDYYLTVQWKSAEATEITDLSLEYRDNKVTSPFATKSRNQDWVTTINICDERGCLKSGGQKALPITHTNLYSDATVSVLARTNTGVDKDCTVVLNRRIAPEQPRFIFPRLMSTPELLNFIEHSYIDRDGLGRPPILRHARKHNLRPVLELTSGGDYKIVRYEKFI